MMNDILPNYECKFFGTHKKECSLISTLIYLIVLFETSASTFTAYVRVLSLTIQMGINFIFICTLRVK